MGFYKLMVYSWKDDNQHFKAFIFTRFISLLITLIHLACNNIRIVRISLNGEMFSSRMIKTLSQNCRHYCPFCPLYMQPSEKHRPFTPY